MRMSEKTYENLNNLTAMCFNANAIIDNLAYSLDFHYYNQIADIVHHKVAHVMPEWADLITNEMLILSGRPIRKDINGYDKDYTDVAEVFEELFKTIYAIREAVKGVIESADMAGDDEVRIFGEDFLAKHVQPMLKQCEEWINASKVLSAHEFNIHIKEYTHFISL